ncbi:hypothetical protein LJC20_06800 [Eubacteriales bacterium OttesenSCG-928-M02]|nr:hypothetical protein [Eubacteriales bacterium OttesenSCG-928-M02]
MKVKGIFFSFRKKKRRKRKPYYIFIGGLWREQSEATRQRALPARKEGKENPTIFLWEGYGESKAKRRGSGPCPQEKKEKKTP